MKFSIEGIRGYKKTAGGESVGYYIFGTSPQENIQGMYGITFDHVINNSTFYSIRANFFTQEVNQNRWETARDTTILKVFGINDGYRMDEQPYGFWVNPTMFQLTYGDGWLIGGPGADHYDNSKTQRVNFKFDITNQLNRYNLVQAGVQVILEDYDINYGVDGYATSHEVDWNAQPIRIQGYIQDKLEFEGFTANLGVRADYYDPKSDYYGVDPFSKYFTAKYQFDLVKEAPSEVADPSFTLSPRLGIAHPITEVSKLFFNYGHFYSMGIADQMFEIYYAPAGQGIGSIGNANLKPERTVAYELGYEHEIAGMFLLRVTGYYRDITNEIARVNYVNYEETANYFTYENDSYSDIRGIELELRKNWGKWVTGWINYTYQVFTGGQIGREFNYQDPRRQFAEGIRNPIQERPLPQPYLNANIRIMPPKDWGPTLGGYHFLEELGVNFLIRWETGEYFTWDPVPPFTEQNNVKWKDRWNVDLRLNKYFDVSDFRFNLFVDVRNVFDLYYLIGGFYNFEDFRDYMNSLHLPIYKAQKYQELGYTAGNDQVGDVKSDDKPYINMPNLTHAMWNPPSSVVLGLRVIF
jgi:outer membrane receptor protein involved in Fe transport